MMIDERDLHIAHAAPPHLSVTVHDERMGQLGYVVIDRPVRGETSGGIRFTSGVSPEELAQLARSMTYKWAFLNVPLGGAKAGICADLEQLGCDRVTLMEAFGRAIAPLVHGRVYHPGIDMGLTLDDLRAVMRGAGRPLVGEQIDASLCTGLTVVETVRQAARACGLELDGLRVAIEGFGKVGTHVAELLAEAGARLVALSTVEGAIVDPAGLDVARLLSLKEQYGDPLVHRYPGLRAVPSDALFVCPTDLLVPGARPHAIHARNVGHVQARLIVPIANAPVAPKAEEMLHARGIVLMPDFVSNCGGVMAANVRGAGFDVEDVRRVVEGTFAQIVAGMLRLVQQDGRSVCDVARALAWQNHRKLNQATALSPNVLQRATRVLRSQDAGGTWRRIAWRLYRQWPRAVGSVREAAFDRYVELTLGTMLARLT